MPRKRIHELAKEWGMDTRYLLSRLEELGVQGKKAQSTLTDEEIALVRPGPAVPDTSALVLGEEKIVGERVVTELDQQNEQVVTAREEISESRISHGVIRRRAKRVEVFHEEEPGAPAISEAPPLPMLDVPFASSSALPLAFEIPEAEPTSAIPVAPLPESEREKLVPASHSVAAPPHRETTEPPSFEKESEPAPVRIEASAAPTRVKEEAPVSMQEPRMSPTPPPSMQLRETPRPLHERPPVIQRPPVSSVGGVGTPPARVPVAMSPGAATPPVQKGEPPRPSRILGRIDLAKLAPEPRPRPVEVRPTTRPPASAPGRPATSQPAGPATREPSREGGTPPPAGGEATPLGAAGRRPKKRKVIRADF